MQYEFDIDYKTMNDVMNKYNQIITIEEGMKIGGFGAYILDYLNNNNYTGKIKNIGIKDEFIGQGTRDELLYECGLSADNLINEIKK